MKLAVISVGTYPVGKLERCSENEYAGVDDSAVDCASDIESIEIFFLHYHSEQGAKEKWERRIKRINWDKLLI